MTGIRTNIKDLGKSFKKWSSAELAADCRKKVVIEEFKNEFLRLGFSQWMAAKLAEEKYNKIHKP